VSAREIQSHTNGRHRHMQRRVPVPSQRVLQQEGQFRVAIRHMPRLPVAYVHQRPYHIAENGKRSKINERV
jgi:hypothetical protein